MPILYVIIFIPQKSVKNLALKYSDIIRVKKKERQAMVKGMDIVYIYHDKIDEASHTSNSAVFPACDEAIQEIKNMMHIIVNEMNSTRAFITADHGFIYTYSPLREDSKVDKTSSDAKDVEVDRRYLITKKGAKPDFLLPVRFMDEKTDYEAFAPREYVRIKKKGGGLNFVHGGISLQEMVVLVLNFEYFRQSTQKYLNKKDELDTKPVEVDLVSSNRLISNMIFNLNFLQKDPVGGNRQSASYQVYFEDSEKQKVSDINRIIADKESDNPKERAFRCKFNLKRKKYSRLNTYYLVIADESGLQQPVKEEFHINISIPTDDIDF